MNKARPLTLGQLTALCVHLREKGVDGKTPFLLAQDGDGTAYSCVLGWDLVATDGGWQGHPSADTKAVLLVSGATWDSPKEALKGGL